MKHAHIMHITLLRFRTKSTRSSYDRVGDTGRIFRVSAQGGGCVETGVPPIKPYCSRQFLIITYKATIREVYLYLGFKYQDHYSSASACTCGRPRCAVRMCCLCQAGRERGAQLDGNVAPRVASLLPPDAAWHHVCRCATTCGSRASRPLAHS